MSYHITHSEHYILIEPEFDYFEVEDLDEIIDHILGDFSEVRHVIFYLGNLDYFNADDIEQLEFMNGELNVKSGYLLLVSTSDSIMEQLKDKILISPSIEDAIELVNSECLDQELFSEDNL
jgi:hypothetical protein